MNVSTEGTSTVWYTEYSTYTVYTHWEVWAPKPSSHLWSRDTLLMGLYIYSHKKYNYWTVSILRCWVFKYKFYPLEINIFLRTCAAIYRFVFKWWNLLFKQLLVYSQRWINSNRVSRGHRPFKPKSPPSEIFFSAWIFFSDAENLLGPKFICSEKMALVSESNFA